MHSTYISYQDELAMELLARLSRLPAPTRLLCRDLHISPEDLCRLRRTLNDMDFHVVKGTVRGQVCMWVAEHGWRDAERAAEGYVRRLERQGLE